MEITRAILEQFFEGGCTKEQEREIKEWLLKHPDIVAEYMTEENWKSFKPDAIPTGTSEKMYRYISKKISPRFHYRQWAAAAVLLILLSTAFLLIQQQQGKQPVSIVQVAVRCLEVENNSYFAKNITLPDGSLVSLSPGSVISFDSVFDARRDIELSGGASFSVVKDRARPFCVHTRNINVTALGTVFSVDDQDSLFTRVRLLEGKVVVKKEPHIVKNMDAVFLTPGQELQFNNVDFSNRVQSFLKEEVRNKPANVPEVSSPTVMEFDNEPMAAVLKRIEKAYHIKITFSESALSEMRFTGTHKPSFETLEQFLHTLAMLNHLKIEKTKKGFSILPIE